MPQIATCPCGKVFVDDYKAYCVEGVVVCSMVCAAMLKAMNGAFPAAYKGFDTKEPPPEPMKKRIQ